MAKNVATFAMFVALVLFSSACTDNKGSGELADASVGKSGGDISEASVNILTEEERNSMTPDQVIALLSEGNKRFAARQLTERDYVSQVKSTATGQFPMAIVLSCLDSRIPPELIFDRGIGDLFVGRVAGNFENQDMLGSMEFGAKLMGARVIVVLGHTECGAVKGACDGVDVELGNLTAMLRNFDAAIERVGTLAGERSSKNKKFVQAVTEANVYQTMEDILANSEVIRTMVDSGQVKVVGGMYDVGNGQVSWLN